MDGARSRKVMVTASVIATPVLGAASALVGPAFDSSDERMLRAIAADQPRLGRVRRPRAAEPRDIAGHGRRPPTHVERSRPGAATCRWLPRPDRLPRAPRTRLIATDLVKGQMTKEACRLAMVRLAAHYAAPSGIHWFYRSLIAQAVGLVLLAALP